MIDFNQKIYIGVLVVLVFLIILIWYNNSIYHSFLEGWWVADTSFLNEINLSQIMLNINSDTGYLIMVDNSDEVVKNEEIEINLSNNWFQLFNSNNYSTTINMIDESGSKLFDDDLELELDLNKGYLLIKKDEELYLELFKDNVLSETSAVYKQFME